jgi:UDP-N-acetylmuramoyl-L-alanyl-D-glutamate--2,6-diaminopimelate ligase
MAESTAELLIDFSIIDSQAKVYAENAVCDMQGIAAQICSPWGSFQLQSPLLGEFNLSNLVAAAAVLLGLGVTVDAIAEAIPKLKPVPGRMECLRSTDGVLAVIDYAHKPDALEKVLKALRPITAGKLRCVMGCGGDRDRSKRPLMGAIAEKFSDAVVVTNDNPRSESATAIIAEICAGMRGAPLVVAERDAAIANAIAAAKPGDVVLIAGKGHEEYQEIAGRRLPFSDIQCARLALAARSGL